LAVVYRRIEELQPAPRNPRSHSPRQVRQIARSVQTFGFNVPILIDPQSQVIAGHGRLLAARELGWGEVPTISLDHLSEAQRQAFMIADNRLTDTSEWNDTLLAGLFRDLSVLDLDFSLEATGFEMAEIDIRIESLEAPQEADDPADHIPDAASRPAVSHAGDVWAAGRHRISCGSALDAVAYAVLMDGEQAAMVFSDPPYNVAIDGHVTGLGKIHHREFAMASGEMDEAQFVEFLVRSFTLLARHSVDGAIQFQCIDWRHAGDMLAAGRRAYSELKNICVWVKSNAGMGSLFRNQHELVFVFKHGRGPHQNNIQLGRHGRHRSNVWSYPGASSFGRSSEEGKLSELHPTVKPVAMVADAILDCSSRGEIVLDAFLGSGTTVIAAQRTGRRCFGLEIDPLYVDTIVRRWQAFTGDHARLLATGQDFNSIEADGEHVHD
jgi:DNA modification methylase